jgi:hypothetical protein
MHFAAVRKTGITFAIGALIFCCSCEKHHVGELPEVQRENVDLAKPSEKSSSAWDKTSTSPGPPVKSPTPAEFFPASTPR